MSSLIVEIVRIENIQPHPNADRLEMAKVKGWEIIIGKGIYAEGEKCVFFPPDSVLPIEVSDKLGVTQYLSKGRVKAVRLRGEPSYGVTGGLDTLGLPDLLVGTDVTVALGITKYEPPISCDDGTARAEHPLFHRYTNIENIKNNPNVFEEGEEVVITEKLHGTNCRIGAVYDSPSQTPEWYIVAGSHRVQREEGKSIYWEHADDNIETLLFHITNLYGNSVIIFGEIYGNQKGMRYGMSDGETELRIFDISINGLYLDYLQQIKYCAMYGLSIVPLLYRGPYSNEIVEEHTYGNTTLGSDDKFKGKEGIVIRPIKERRHRNGRCIFKSVSVDYLSRNDISDSH